MHCTVRSRIERMFAHLMRWRIFRGCDHGAAWLQKALRLITAVEHFKGCTRKANPNASDHVVTNPAKRFDWSADPICNCKFSSHDKQTKESMHAHRQQLMSNIGRSGLYKGVEEKKGPAKGGATKKVFTPEGPGMTGENALQPKRPQPAAP
uniref:Uncharacterized protein n=1 Tax=Neobodo designis TaxID=312471 RepID=A0A7S1Q0J1_NEODS|mmetsp:Transcript_27106/g.83965  ORF Transcript_27106/g.83965 Transcript_27106/m.83965 type:complete len:151 (+) Transcript_27106:473-925(+)